ncbi:4752_t:CDS:2 [Cetraspora pellucida]|uniref:4752_t:CDS:1 n=1 Tax=Cetraspora pellucida TaxID=1433469 RepID=A0A9N9JF94_9GLOM|nr:4752_t:CDS:2 [Cetraspora pellucida]
MADSETSNITPPFNTSHSTTPPPSSPVLQAVPAFSSSQIEFPYFPSSTFVSRQQKTDSEQEEVRQSAVNALHQYSILAMHVISSEESPAQTRLRMLRYAAFEIE